MGTSSNVKEENKKLKEELKIKQNQIDTLEKKNAQIWRENESIYQKNFNKIKNSKMIDDSIKAEELILRFIDFKLPEIFFDKNWVLNRSSSQLDQDLKSFINAKLANKGEFLNEPDCNLDYPSRLLKEQKQELLTQSLTKILQNKTFINDCKKKFDEFLKQNTYPINSFFEKIKPLNMRTARNVYIKKYEREINKIKNNPKKNEIKYFTVLVIGKSGVGKSCLINNILNLRIPEEGKKKEKGIDGAMEAQGGFVTSVNEDYISNTVKGIRCIDTPGCDLNGHSIDYTIKECQKEINKQYNNKDPSNYVSIIWYCFSGNRFDNESDVELIKKIRATYNGDQIPVIIVRTQAYFEKENENFESIIKKKKLGTDYIAVIARDQEQYKQKNLVELVELSISNIQKALNGQFYKVLSKEIRENLVKKLKDENIKINEFTKEQMVLYFMNNYNETLSKSDFLKFIQNLFIICFSFYLVEFNNDEISNEIMTQFNDFIKVFIENAYNEYIALSMKEVNADLFENSLKLIDLQNQVQKEANSNIKPENLNTFPSFRSIISNFLFENLFYIAQKLLINVILQKILFPLCDLIRNEYNNNIVSPLINDFTVGQLIRETYQLKFDELKRKFSKNNNITIK